MTPNQIIVHEACMDLLTQAIAQYGLQDQLSAHDVEISFNLRGRTGGQACYRGYLDFKLRFNIEAVEDYLHFTLSDIVPHEIAHIICRAKPHLGKNHNAGWVRVCKMLGGSASRTHPLPLTRAKRSQKHIYIVMGEEFHVGTTQHKRIQSQERTYHVKMLIQGRVRIEPAMYTNRSYTQEI